MLPILCQHRGNECDCTEGPFENLSAEAPDPPIFLPQGPRIPNDPGVGPWWTYSCHVKFVSFISQEDAEQQATNANLECDWNPPPDPDPCDPEIQVCDGGPPGCDNCPPPPPTANFAYSDAKTCTFDCGGGVTSSFSLAAGSVASPLSLLDANTKADALCLKKLKENTLCFDPDIAPACVGSGYSFQLAISGGTGPYLVTLPSGGLPAGFVMDGAGLITGSPTVAGSFTFIVLVTDSTLPLARSALGTVTFRVVEITSPATIPAFTIGTPYSYTFTQTGADLPLSWTVVSGALPAGLTLDEQTGVLSGTPTAAATGPFTVLLQDRAT